MIVGSFLVTRMRSALRQIDQLRRFVRCWQAIGIIALVSLFSPNARAQFAFPFAEDWESGSIDSTRWDSWGYPDPVLDNGTSAVGSYSLDPNGNESYLSGLVSADTFALSGGVRVSIDAYIESASSWSELSFGLADTTSVTPNNVHLMHVATINLDADTQGNADPPENNYKYYSKFQNAGDDVSIVYYGLSGNALLPFFDTWHTFQFDFAANGSAQVRVDDVLTFETVAGFYDYNTDNEFSVLLGGRSYSSTVNLYDSISVSLVPEPSAGLLALFGLTLLPLSRRR